MDDNMRVISTEEELKIFNDPYRMKIIRTYQQSEVPLTVKGCADIMGEVPAKVHYHVKKLLNVDILELDHIEVINGINAKFYKLPKTSFTISLKDTDENNHFRQLGQVHNIVSNIIEDFKQNFMKSTAIAVERKLKEDSESGMIASNEIHLSEEEFKEVSEYLSNISKKYKSKSEGKKSYIFMGGLGRKMD
jgi:hypothetical protein